jgi:hypothetical protein
MIIDEQINKTNATCVSIDANAIEFSRIEKELQKIL